MQWFNELNVEFAALEHETIFHQWAARQDERCTGGSTGRLRRMDRDEFTLAQPVAEADEAIRGGRVTEKHVDETVSKFGEAFPRTQDEGKTAHKGRVFKEIDAALGRNLDQRKWWPRGEGWLWGSNDCNRGTE